MRPLRRLALGFASALALAGAARGGDITYPGLTTATTVQDTDLIATWRASGPLSKVQASVLSAYLQGKLSPLFLQPVNNLSDVASAATARTNLGLGSAAQASTGTSGANLCLMNANCTWSGTETFQAAVTFGATAVHTGLLTANAGITDNGALSVSGASTLAGVTASGITSGAFSLNQAVGGFNYDALQTAGVTMWTLNLSNDAPGSGNTGATFNIGRWTNAGAFIDSPIQINRSSGLTTINDGLTVNNGLTVTGAVNLPNASLSSAVLSATIGAGSCGSSTSACILSANAQGQITSLGSATVIPSLSGTAGAALSSNGSATTWSMRARGVFVAYNGGISSFSGSTNIASLTRLSTGCYHVTFSNAFPNANYSFTASAGGTSSSGNLVLFVSEEDGEWNRTTTDFGFCVYNVNANPFENGDVVSFSFQAN